MLLLAFRFLEPPLSLKSLETVRRIAWSIHYDDDNDDDDDDDYDYDNNNDNNNDHDNDKTSYLKQFDKV